MSRTPLAVVAGFAVGLTVALWLSPGPAQAQIIPSGGACNPTLQCRAASFSTTGVASVGSLTTTGTVTATGTDAGFISSAASGANGFANTTIGARIDFGPGAADYAWSDGGVVTFANPVNVVGALSSTAGVSGTTGGFSSLVTRTGTGAGFTSEAASGTNAFACTVTGCRIQVGAGANAWFTSDSSGVFEVAGSTTGTAWKAASVVGTALVRATQYNAVATAVPMFFDSEQTSGGASPTVGAFDFQSTGALDATDLHTVLKNASNADIWHVTYAGNEVVSGSLTVTGTASAIAQPAWTAPSLLNSWVDFGAPYEVAGYFKDTNGRVCTKGLIKNGTATTGTTLFTFPVGFRPANQRVMATVSNSLFCAFNIETDGDVNIGGGSCSNVFFSLENICFDTR